MEPDFIEVRADGRPRVRKVYSLTFKRRVVGLTFQAGASVSQIAQRHGLNTNLLFAWRRDPANSQPGSAPAAALLPVTVGPLPAVPVSPTDSTPPAAPASQPDAKSAYIEVEIGNACLRLHGGVDMATVTAIMRILERNR